MDLVDGEDLRAVLRRDGTLSPDRAIAIVRQVLEGLADAHAQGVVHRDIKPENVLLTRRDGDESIRLVDFGVARITEHASTAATGVVGTPNYMAPEIASGRVPAGGADVYAAGVVLHEALFGRPPFVGATVAQVLHAQQTAKLERPGGTPDALWKVLRRMLDRRPERRPTAGEAADVLSRLPAAAVPTSAFAAADTVDLGAATVRGDRHPSTKEPEPVRAAHGRPARRVPRWLIVGVLVALVGAGIWFGVARAPSSASTACATGAPFHAPAPFLPQDREIYARDAAGHLHVGRYFAGTFIGFGNRGLLGKDEEPAMIHAGALPAEMDPLEISLDEYKALPNRPTDGTLFEEWTARPGTKEPALYFSVGGTVARTSAAAVRAIGLHPASAVKVPRYALSDLETTLPADGTLFHMGDTSYVIRRGRRVVEPPCRGSAPVRVPSSPSLLDRIPT
jgi:hypothetical protein